MIQDKLALILNKKVKPSPNYLIHEQTKIRYYLEVANKLNSYFTKIGHNLADIGRDPISYLNMENINVFTFEDADENTISKIIDTLQSKTTCGSDGISMTQIKYMKETLLAPITLIIRQVLHTGIFPHKKDDEPFLVTIDQYPSYLPFQKLSKK